MTDNERAVLAHVVEDPDAWYAQAAAHFGEEKAKQFLAQKVARWAPEYVRERAKLGYKNRVQREDESRQIDRLQRGVV